MQSYRFFEWSNMSIKQKLMAVGAHPKPSVLVLVLVLTITLAIGMLDQKASASQIQGKRNALQENYNYIEMRVSSL
jgi:hypothetical protein